MVSPNWLTLLSLLVSGTMLFTLAATVFLYAKYKLAQKPVLRAHDAPEVAIAGGQALSLNEAIQILNETQVQTTSSVAVKKKVRFASTSTGNGVE